MAKRYERKSAPVKAFQFTTETRVVDMPEWLTDGAECVVKVEFDSAANQSVLEVTGRTNNHSETLQCDQWIVWEDRLDRMTVMDDGVFNEYFREILAV